MKSKNPVKSKLIAVGALIAFLVLLLLLKTNTAICEFVATTFARGWIWLAGHMFGWLPFSLFEMFLIVAISAVIVCVVIIIKRLCTKKRLQALSLLLSVAIVALSGINLYTATASFSYEREPLPTEIVQSYNGENVAYEEAIAIAEYVIEQVNSTYQQLPHNADGNVIMPTLAELNELLRQEYKRLDSDYFSPYTPNVKGILNKRIMSELHITGVFFAPFGEPNINVTRMDVFTPSVIAHELAHSKGVMRESDANTVASYLLLTSDNAFLRYSGYVDCLSSALRMVRMYPNSNSDYASLSSLIHPGVSREIANYNKHWMQYKVLDDIGDFFNDIYLKLQGQKDGTDSYVEPPKFEITGDKDDDGNDIVVILKFSNTQNVLINLYKQGLIG